VVTRRVGRGPVATAALAATVMLDGVLVSADEAVVSVFDRGFLYGDAVFETIRTYGGHPFELEKHVARLASSAERVLIELPVSPQVLAEEVTAAIRAAALPEAYVRLMVTRGASLELGLAPGEDAVPLRVVLVLPLVPPPPTAYTRGIEAVTYTTRRAADATDAQGAKVANYLVSVLALRRARVAGASEALVVDGDGTVVEGATSNVFAVIGGVLVTPPEDAGILVGITRERVIAAARDLGISVVLRRLPLAELLGAGEVFISSSIREMLPVVRVDGVRIGDGEPGVVTRGIHEAFRRGVRRDMGEPGVGPEC
jgi:branched-chain amino acid aminotransferase